MVAGKIGVPKVTYTTQMLIKEREKTVYYWEMLKRARQVCRSSQVPLAGSLSASLA